MYAKPADIEEYLTNNPQKPYISCEYMHTMVTLWWIETLH
ncbi:MAG: glycoside hydrolase family 2 TIM barrel-domain containing protein [Streptococcus salivarius]